MGMGKVGTTMLCCFMVLLTLVCVMLFLQTLNQGKLIDTLNGQAQIQQNQTRSLLSQLQQCQSLGEVDTVLRMFGVERIKKGRRK